jgi:hypothetical protein
LTEQAQPSVGWMSKRAANQSIAFQHVPIRVLREVPLHSLANNSFRRTI